MNSKTIECPDCKCEVVVKSNAVRCKPCARKQEAITRDATKARQQAEDRAAGRTREQGRVLRGAGRRKPRGPGSHNYKFTWLDIRSRAKEREHEREDCAKYDACMMRACRFTGSGSGAGCVPCGMDGCPGYAKDPMSEKSAVDYYSWGDSPLSWDSM